MTGPSLLFVLPVSGGSGGANSVVQEAIGLTRLGLPAAIAVSTRKVPGFLSNYPELSARGVEVLGYADARELALRLAGCAIACATTNTSVHEIAEALPLCKGTRPLVAYYVQDYEPLFYPARSAQWQMAYSSYTALPGMVLFAKTQWICDTVYANHGVRVNKVEASIDHDIYFPGRAQPDGRPTVVAMLRPQTPRRAPRRTVRILEALAARHGDGVHLRVFGCDDAVLVRHGIALSPAIENAGQLKRFQVPDVLRHADLFLDLSDYQAFGRTGLEGMACGVVPVLPVFGGAVEFAVDRENAYLVDTRSDDAILAAVGHFMDLPVQTRRQMRLNALHTAGRYSIHRAALSELALFQAMLDSR